MKIALATFFVLTVTPAEACHHYTRWYYPWAQSCFPHRSAYRAPVVARGEDKTWYVEVAPPIPDLKVPDEVTPQKSLRTEDQIEEEAAHDEAVKSNKDELNAQLKALKEKEEEAK